jgi:hypothetical protein
MVPAPFIVVVDANVLFPLTLRDTVLRAAAADFYQLRWSKEILDEMERNLVSTGTMPADKAARLRGQMEKFFPEAMVTGYEPLIAAMQNDAKDRHVVAATVKAGAQVVTTANLKDFTPLPDGIEAQSPDEFLCMMLMPFTSRKTTAASTPARLFPSTNGWLLTMWKRYAAAIAKSPPWANSPPNDAWG